MKKLPIGIQTFRDIREENYCYADKTPLIHQLATQGGRRISCPALAVSAKACWLTPWRKPFPEARSCLKDCGWKSVGIGTKHTRW